MSRRIGIQFIFILVLISACVQNSASNQGEAPTAVLNGQIYFSSKPSSTIVVYVVDHVAGRWFSKEVAGTDNALSFSLDVRPGTYELFAFSKSGEWGGYSTDGLALAKIYVEAGQIKSDLPIRPPHPSECGPYFGLPASPDGRFRSTAGASELCLSELFKGKPSIITGRVLLQDSSENPVFIYAVDYEADVWFSTQIFGGDDTASFRLEVPSGKYQVFAFSESGAWGGYSEDGTSLVPIRVDAAQTVSDIRVQPAIPSECGPFYGVPASPDGRFQAIKGASQECLLALEDKMMCGNRRPGDDFQAEYSNTSRAGLEAVSRPVEAILAREFTAVLSAMESYNTIQGDELVGLLDNYTMPFMIDVRTVEEVQKQGHIAGAVHIPLDELTRGLEYLPGKDVQIITYCSSGWRAAIAMTVLSGLGWDRVRALNLPFTDWVSAGYPVVAGVPDPPAVMPQLDLDSEIVAALDVMIGVYGVTPYGGITTEDFKTALGENPGLLVLDVRRAEEIATIGSIDTGVVENLHIPLEELVQRMEHLPTDRYAEIFIYCGSGNRSTMAMTILGAYGYGRVFSLIGGYRAWTEPGYPINK